MSPPILALTLYATLTFGIGLSLLITAVMHMNEEDELPWLDDPIEPGFSEAPQPAARDRQRKLREATPINATFPNHEGVEL